jgi:LCP family protein required for cell wall assembly
MAQRPPGKGGPDDGEPEFDWLYGGKGAPPPDDATRAVPRQPRPDETRVMPTAPRPGQRSRSGQQARRPATPPPGRPTAPPRGPSPSPAPKSSRRRPRFRFRWLLILLLLWVVWLVAVPLFAWSKVDKVPFEPSGSRPADQPGTTYLLVGSDSRAGLSAEQRKALHTGNAAGKRTDTIMLLHTGSGPNLLMSIPRDSSVDVPGHGTTKINAAYSYGRAKLLVKTIEQDTGIRIDDYVKVGFGGVVEVVDAVGGVQICPPTAMKDKLANLDVKKGCQQADGTTALAYARSRHADKYGDLGRAAHQREVVSSVGRKVVSPWTILNPIRYWKINMAAPDSFEFGEGTSPLRAAMWASAMTHVNGDSGMTCGVPISDFYVHWDPARSKQMFNYIIKDDTADIPKSLCTPTGIAGTSGS